MVSGQKGRNELWPLREPPGQQRQMLTPGRSRLLQQHPVLVPFVLISGSVVLCIVSFFADTLFPLLAYVGMPTPLLCISLALVLGIGGLLASIISIIESIDRHRLRTAMYPQPKEQSYANRN